MKRCNTKKKKDTILFAFSFISYPTTTTLHMKQLISSPCNCFIISTERIYLSWILLSSDLSGFMCCYLRLQPFSTSSRFHTSLLAKHVRERHTITARGFMIRLLFPERAVDTNICHLMPLYRKNCTHTNRRIHPIKMISDWRDK